MTTVVMATGQIATCYSVLTGPAFILVIVVGIAADQVLLRHHAAAPRVARPAHPPRWALRRRPWPGATRRIALSRASGCRARRDAAARPVTVRPAVLPT